MENDVILFVNFVHIKTPCYSMAPLWVDRVALWYGMAFYHYQFQVFNYCKL